MISIDHQGEYARAIGSLAPRSTLVSIEQSALRLAVRVNGFATNERWFNDRIIESTNEVRPVETRQYEVLPVLRESTVFALPGSVPTVLPPRGPKSTEYDESSHALALTATTPGCHRDTLVPDEFSPSDEQLGLCTQYAESSRSVITGSSVVQVLDGWRP